jgi:hypothetical protein
MFDFGFKSITLFEKWWEGYQWFRVSFEDGSVEMFVRREWRDFWSRSVCDV